MQSTMQYAPDRGSFVPPNLPRPVPSDSLPPGKFGPQAEHSATTTVTAPLRQTGSRILVVEQDAPLARFLGRCLAAERFAVDIVHDDYTAQDRLSAGSYDLVLMSVVPGLPEGMALLERTRRDQPRLPAIVLTAAAGSEDLVQALELGADDFVRKPFSFLELVARMRSVLRRSVEANPVSAGHQTRIGPLTVNREEYRVDRNGRSIDLTPREFEILENLAQHVGRPVSRATLMEEVWKTPFNPSSNIVDVYMKYLRDKIDHDGEAKLIRTVRGVGYVLDKC